MLRRKMKQIKPFKYKLVKLFPYINKYSIKIPIIDLERHHSLKFLFYLLYIFALFYSRIKTLHYSDKKCNWYTCILSTAT
jgi:hypothetical protein